MIRQLAFEEFPTFCATLVGLYAYFDILLNHLSHYFSNVMGKARLGAMPKLSNSICRFLAAFLSAWISMHILNRTSKSRITSFLPKSHGRLHCWSTELDEISAYKKIHNFEQDSITSAGRTMDLTSFAVARSLEAVIGDVWSRHKTSRIAKDEWSATEALASKLADTAVFAVSSGVVMWAWFYFPSRLPRAYRKWIRRFAQVDDRLVEVLRKARTGEFVYGRDTGQAPLLGSMCEENNWSLVWGDPAQTIPIPCEVVHSGLGPSCHWHAVARFSKAFKFAFATYLPFQLIVKGRKISWQTIWRAVRDALRSSSFLGAFVGLFYYGVCLARTQMGPKVFSKDRITPMMWDQGLCIRAGCILCGWSILIERAKRRQELAFFVAPKALATFLPRRYDKQVGFHPQRSKFANL